MRPFCLRTLLLVSLGLYIWQGSEAFGQLQDLEIERLSDEECRPRVLTEYAEHALLIIGSSITDLTIDSVLGLVARPDSPDAQEYRVVVYARNQILTIRAAGYHPAELPLRDLSPRGTYCYSVERAGSRDLQEIEALVTAESYDEAVTRLQAYLLRTNLDDRQTRQALYWQALALSRLDRPAETNEAVGRLLDVGFPPGVAPGTLPASLREAVWTNFRIPPDPPTALRGSYINGQVHLSWSASTAGDLGGYRIYRDLDPASRTRLVQIESPSATSYVDAGAVSNTTYYYRIAAFDTLGSESTPSVFFTLETVLPLGERLSVAHHEAPIRNIRVTFTDTTLVVTYDLDGKSSLRYRVDLALSNNDGASFSLIPATVSGDVGRGIQAGTGRRVEWSYRDDFPEGLNAPAYRLRLTTQKQRGLWTPALLTIGGALVAGGTVAILTSVGGGGSGGDRLGRPVERPPIDP